MPQIAGFRGALWDRSKVDLAEVAAAPLTRVADRLGKGELVRDPLRAMYLYHQTFALAGRPATRKTVLAAVKLTTWDDGTIRPHEATDPGARERAIAGIAAEGAHTTPVLLGYRDAAREVDRLFRPVEDEQPTLDTTTSDGTRHRLWRCTSAEIMGKMRPLFAPKKLHVLDGHARYEGMVAHSTKLGSGIMYSSANYGLGCLVNVEDPALVVAPRHRIMRGAGRTRDEVLAQARTHFVVEQLAGAAGDAARLEAALGHTFAHQPSFVVVFAGEPDAWKLTLSPEVSPVAEGVSVHRGLQRLDPFVVEHMFAARAFPGAPLETATETAAVVRAIGAPSGGASAAILQRPVALEQLLHADELGQVLPFGSTAFRPALASLLAYLIDPDEDLV